MPTTTVTKTPAKTPTKATSTQKRPPARKPAASAHRPAPKPAVRLETEAAQALQATQASEDQRYQEWRAQQAVPVPAPVPPSVPAVQKSTKATAPQYSDEDMVMISVNYGANDQNSQGFFIGDVPFGRNRISNRPIPFAKARALQRLYPTGIVRLHDAEATEPQIALACGIRPTDPAKLAAQIIAMDPDEWSDLLTDEQLALLAEKLAEKALLARTGQR